MKTTLVPYKFGTHYDLSSSHPAPPLLGIITTLPACKSWVTQTISTSAKAEATEHLLSSSPRLATAKDCQTGRASARWKKHGVGVGATSGRRKDRVGGATLRHKHSDFYLAKSHQKLAMVAYPCQHRHTKKGAPVPSKTLEIYGSEPYKHLPLARRSDA